MAFYHVITDIFTGTKRPKAGTPIASKEQVQKAILAINRPTAPFQLRQVAADEPGDLVAEWKIVDAKWYEIFAKAGVKRVFRIFLKLDQEKNEVLAMDREYSVAWKAGVPTIAVQASGFQGQKQSIEFSTAFGFTEKGNLGEIYRYRFATSEMKKPLHKAVTGAGWTYRGVVSLPKK